MELLLFLSQVNSKEFSKERVEIGIGEVSVLFALGVPFQVSNLLFLSLLFPHL